MAKKAYVVMIVTLIVAVLYWITLTPRPGPTKSIEITIGPVLTHKSTITICSVLFSNASNYDVQYPGGFGRTWFETAFLKNHVWESGRVSTAGGGLGVLAPHQVVVETIEVPEGVTELKLGLSITSLTWRGRTAWRILLHWPEFLRPLCGFLLTQDERKRSTIDWSSVYIVIEDRIVPKSEIKTNAETK